MDEKTSQSVGGWSKHLTAKVSWSKRLLHKSKCLWRSVGVTVDVTVCGRNCGCDGLWA